MGSTIAFLRFLGTLGASDVFLRGITVLLALLSRSSAVWQSVAQGLPLILQQGEQCAVPVSGQAFEQIEFECLPVVSLILVEVSVYVALLVLLLEVDYGLQSFHQ